MKSRLIVSLAVLPLVLVAFVGSSARVAHAAMTCNVPSGSYATIQSAVNDANCTTIIVAAGNYSENVSIPSTQTGLVIDGAQAGNPVSGRTFGNAAESTVTGGATSPVFQISAASVTIDGFSVTDPSVTTGSAVGIDVKSVANGSILQNNFVDNVVTTDTTSSGSAQAFYLEAGPDNIQILNNEASGIHGNRSTKAVLIGDSGSADSSTNDLIKGNTFASITSDTRGAYGVQINDGGSNTSNPGNPGLQILNNTIKNLNGGGWVHAIGLEANTPGVLIQNNTISNLTSPPNPNTGATTSIGVWIESEDTSFATGHVNQNSLAVTGSNYGMAVDPALPAGPADGVCNWWGDPSGPGPVGPGSGSKVSPNVNFTPWQTQPGTCPPPAAVPETAVSVLVPLSGLIVVGGWIGFRRRRRLS
jgi:hypothetical protein